MLLEMVQARDGLLDAWPMTDRHPPQHHGWAFKMLEPVVALMAARDRANLAYEQFEYIAVQAQDWIQAHPRGDYPKGVRRIPLTNRWKDDDRTSPA